MMTTFLKLLSIFLRRSETLDSVTVNMADGRIS